MISLHNIGKSYRTKKGSRRVLNNLSYHFPRGRNIGIIGRNGQGKSTLLRIISGSMLPDEGRVVRHGRISWPIGFSGGFNQKITGRENLRFITRLYDHDYREVSDFVEDFAELGEYMDMPLYTYSSGMRAKLAFGLSMAFDFECYLIDEVTAVGDAGFRKKSEAFFERKRKVASLIVVSHNMGMIKKLCDEILVLNQGKLLEFASKEEAEAFYVDVCGGRRGK